MFEENEYKLRNVSEKIVLDIGGNIGAFSCLSSSNGAKKVIAIEPFKPNCHILRQNTDPYGNITVVNMAISNQDGQEIALFDEAEFIEHWKKCEANRKSIGARYTLGPGARDRTIAEPSPLHRFSNNMTLISSMS